MANLNEIVESVNSGASLHERRARYVALVQTYLDFADSLTRFKSVLKARGTDDFEQILISAGDSLDLGYKELTSVFPGTRNVLFVDTETTGVGASDEPITVAAVLASVDCRTGLIRREFHSYYGEREPACVISPNAARVHGISVADLLGKKFDLRLLVSLFIAADYVVAHNAEFDKRMLKSICAEDHDWRCSLRGVPWPGEVGGRSLDALCEHFSIQRPSPHNSMWDVRALMALLGKRDHMGRTFLAGLIR